MSTEGSPSGSDEMWEKDLLLSEGLREELRHPFGVLITGEEALAAVDECGPLVLVGDVVSHDMLRKGIQPKLVIYDGKTERRDMTDLLPIIERMRGHEVRVRNPAATISASLIMEVRQALSRSGSTKILVDGEEDLAALACVALAPEGACIIYGYPGKGVVLVRNDRETIMKARSLMSRMEESL